MQLFVVRSACLDKFDNPCCMHVHRLSHTHIFKQSHIHITSNVPELIIWAWDIKICWFVFVIFPTESFVRPQQMRCCVHLLNNQFAVLINWLSLAFMLTEKGNKMLTASGDCVFFDRCAHPPTHGFRPSVISITIWWEAVDCKATEAVRIYDLCQGKQEEL